jgi:hypothetical protein
MANERALFQELARFRLEEAKLLFQNKLPCGAYYLAGYAIECALKARIAAQFRENEIPDRALVNKVYTHDLSDCFAWPVLRPNWMPQDERTLNSIGAGRS